MTIKSISPMLLPCLLLLLLLPWLAHAQPYKCQQADGKLSYQDQPCASGAKRAAITAPPLPPAQLPPAGADGAQAARGQQRGSAAAQRLAEAEQQQRQRQDQDIKALNERIEAQNRALRCDRARQNLGALKTARPVFTYDNKGERQYIDDKARQSEIAAAQAAVAQNCN